MTKYLKQVFILLIVILLSQVTFSQKNQTINASKSLNKPIDNNQQDTLFIAEKILSESQKNFDRTLTILNIIVTGIGVLVGLIAIFVTIAIALGLFQYRRWSKIRKDAERSLKEIQEIRKKAENELSESIKKIKETPIENVSKEEIEYLKHRVEDLEILGTPPPDGLFVKGLSFYEKKDYESALKIFDKAIELIPNDAGIWYNKGVILNNLNKFEDALKAYEKAIELKPNYAFAWNNKGVTLNELGKYEEAIKALDKAIELDPKNATAWNNKGIPLDNLNKFEDALKAYEKAIELKPNFAFAWNNKGTALDHFGKYEEAIKAYDKAIELDQKYAAAWINKGESLIKLNKYEEAIKAYDKAIELEPKNATAWFNRACYYSIKKKKDEALTNLKKAIELNSKCKEEAKKDENFKFLWKDERFKKLVN